MHKLDTITIAIPTLNRLPQLQRALSSAISQTEKRLELVVSNNGSTDGTREYLETLNNTNIRVFHIEKTIPVATHLKYIVQRLQTSHVCILSDDDWLEPEFARKTLALFREHSAVQIVHTRVRVHTELTAELGPAFPTVQEGHNLLLEFLTTGRGPSLCGTVYKTDDVYRCSKSLPDDAKIGDLYMWPQIVTKGTVCFADEPLANYTRHAESETARIRTYEWLVDHKRAQIQWESSMCANRIDQERIDKCRNAAENARAKVALSHQIRRAEFCNSRWELLREVISGYRTLIPMTPSRFMLLAATIILGKRIRHLRLIAKKMQ